HVRKSQKPARLFGAAVYVDRDLHRFLRSCGLSAAAGLRPVQCRYRLAETLLVREVRMAENLLRRETSPYLLQHADNPVHWRPWGEEALEEARRSGKPILLSIGYAACHWCHVMAHESFENPAIASVMNELFVSIK